MTFGHVVRFFRNRSKCEAKAKCSCCKSPGLRDVNLDVQIMTYWLIVAGEVFCDLEVCEEGSFCETGVRACRIALVVARCRFRVRWCNPLGTFCVICGCATLVFCVCVSDCSRCSAVPILITSVWRACSFGNMDHVEDPETWIWRHGSCRRS